MQSRVKKLAHPSTPSSSSSPIREIAVREQVTRNSTVRETIASDPPPSHSLLDNSPWTAQGVTHDFNNMLSVALSQTSVALKKLPPGSAAEDNLQKARRAVERAVEYSQQLMDHLNGIEEQPTGFSLNQLIRENVDLLDPTYHKRIAIHLKLDDKLPLLSANSCQIQQIIQNLLMNAAESIHHHSGTILIESSLQNLLADNAADYHSYMPLIVGQYIAISIHDNGIGVEPEQVNQIFERHFTTKKQGRGIGLNTVWQIVCEHGGGIKVSSRPNRGSTFEVLLPLASTPATNKRNSQHRLL